MSDQPVPSTLEVAKTSIQLELTKLKINYEKLLQEAEDLEILKDDLPGAQKALEPLKKAKKAMEELDNPYTVRWREWNEAKASLYKPVTEVLSRKTTRITTLNKEVKDEEDRLEAEETRKTNIKTAISDFTLGYSTKIAAATTNEELVTLQKRIGAEKSRSGFYQEFLPKLNEAVEGLEKALKAQKEHVKGLDAAKVQLEEAKEAGDEEKVMEILTGLGEIENKIEETKAGVQEQAINRATAFVAPEMARVIAPARAKAKKTIWTWEIVDMAAFAKKHPDMVSTVADKGKIDDMVRDLKATETIVAGTFHGLKIYQREYL